MVNATQKLNLSSTLKAITADEELEIEFKDDVGNSFFEFNHNLVKEKDVVISSQDKSDTQDYRSLVDLAAAFKMFHNFEKQFNYTKQEQDFIDDFEKIRMILLIEKEFLGCAQNILNKVEQDIDLLSGELNSKSLSIVFLENVLNKKVLPETREKSDHFTKKIDKFEPKLIGLIGNLVNSIGNQEEFAKNTLEIQKLWQNSLENERNNQKEPDKSNENEDLLGKNQENIKNIAKNGKNSADNIQNPYEDEQKPQEGEKNTIKSQENTQKDVKNNPEIKSFSPNSNKFQEEQIEFKNAYKVYSSKYDEIINPQKITNKEDLEMLRLELDSQIGSLGKISKKLTIKLKQKLLSKKFRNPNPNDLEGNLNRKKLASIISSPSPRNLYLENLQHDLNDTAVTILLDNSGSMRGRPIIMAALACEVLAKILENFQIKTEIIGFTTADWKGGRVKKDWEISGKPANPGRLNELRHIIYKSFNQSFKKSKVNLGLMLKEGVLKENIDGEAVLFAKSRLLNREEKRKILMVISDGNPIDDSTNLVNNEDILSDHLKQVVGNIQKQKEIEILAIGVGHDTDGFYQNSITIRKLEELGDAMIQKISVLL